MLDHTTSPNPLNVMLWLYRRLPGAYGRPPFVEQAIRELADQSGQDGDDLLADLRPKVV